MNILIVEDEASIRDRLTRLSRSILGERIQNIATADTLSQASSELASSSFDLLLLDLNLNGKDGFELLKELCSRPFQTIVVSANTQRAIDAFDIGVVDFVPKPFNEERLRKALSRATTTEPTANHFAKYLAVRAGTKIELIPLGDIDFIQADGPCSQIHLSDGTKKSHDKMLKELQRILPPIFRRVHKSYLANFDKISGIESSTKHKHRLAFASGQRIPLSRSSFKDLKQSCSAPPEIC